MNNSDPTIKNIKSEIESSNEDLVAQLTNRFSSDLQLNMLFHIFNYVCHQIDQERNDYNSNSVTLNSQDTHKNSHASNFFHHWLNATKKEIKKEVKEINSKLKNKQLSFLGAISSFSLPSTEDYQQVYNHAFKNVKVFYDRGTGKPKKN